MGDLQLRYIQHYDLSTLQFVVPKLNNKIKTISALNIHTYSVECYEDGVKESYSLKFIKPILRPLSDLYKEIDGKVGIVELAKMLGDFKELLSVSVEDNAVDYMGNPAPYYECKYVSDIDDDIHSTLVFCPDTVSFERLIIYNVHLTRPVSASDFQSTPIRCYNQFYEYLFQHNYDVFGLIDKGLAIDLNSISHE